MAYIAVAHTVVAYVVMAHIVMAYIVMAYIVMAYVCRSSLTIRCLRDMSMHMPTFMSRQTSVRMSMSGSFLLLSPSWRERYRHARRHVSVLRHVWGHVPRRVCKHAPKVYFV